MKTVSVPTDWLNEITGRTVANAIAYLSTLPSDHELNYWQNVGDDHGVEIRSELLCHRPHTEQAEVTDGIRPEDFTVDAVVKSMGGFAQINTKGVRVTHKPTGISVTCDVARSQHANRNQAIETLRAILSQQPDNTACKSVQKRLEAQRPATSEPVDFPAGAIVNGRTLMDRIEAYPFESEGGDLRMCSDWHELRRCFEHLADYVSPRPAPSVPEQTIDKICYLATEIRFAKSDDAAQAVIDSIRAMLAAK